MSTYSMIRITNKSIFVITWSVLRFRQNKKKWNIDLDNFGHFLFCISFSVQMTSLIVIHRRTLRSLETFFQFCKKMTKKPLAPPKKNQKDFSGIIYSQLLR